MELIKKKISNFRKNNSQLFQRSVRIAALLFLLAIILIIYIFPRTGKFNYTFEYGKPWMYETLTAPFDFRIQKTAEEIEKETIDLMKKELYVYLDKDTAVVNIQKEKFIASSQSSSPTADAYVSYISSKLDDVYNKGIVKSDKMSELSQANIAGVKIKSGQTASEGSNLESIFTEKTAYEKIINDAPGSLEKSILQSYNINEYLTPNLSANEQDTHNLEEEIKKKITTTRGMVQIGEKIVDHGMVIDKETYNKLTSLKKNIEGQESFDTGNSALMIKTGHTLLITCIMTIFFFYLVLFRMRFINFRNVLFMLLMIISFCFLTSWVINYSDDSSKAFYMIPYAILPMTVTIFFDTRTALFSHITTIMLCSFIVPDSFTFLFLQITIGMISICTLRDLYKRSQLFVAAIIITCVYSLLYLGVNLINPNSFNSDVTDSVSLYFGFFVINGALTLFAYPFMFMIEKIFSFTSDVTLNELANTNSFLLRELSKKAPGTFQHSWQVSNLAEEAAQAINANSMLARTGALYHDIGKLSDPIYFTENQNGYNPHDMLDEINSARIIISHVKEGVARAKEHGLPDKIIDFIRSHHGKGTANYFYVSYKNKHPEEDVDIENFSYNGPAPTSKEMAIVMMCDATEAASRSLKEYTQENISKLVEKLINKQMEEGAYNDAPITLKEIETVKQVIKDRLEKIYHTRTAYPEEKKTEKKQ